RAEPWAYLAPEGRRAPAPADLREREHEGEERGLDHLAGGEEAARPAPDDGLVADQEVDQQVDPGSLVNAPGRLGQIARLERGRDPPVHVGRIRLVGVLGQPDVLRPEVAGDIP